VTALALSPNGIYLATASKSGVCIWSTQTKQILVRLDPSSEVIVNQMAWSPTENLLVWADGNGAFVRYHDVIPKSFAHPVKLPSASKAAAEKSNDTGLDVAVDNLGMDIDLNGDDDNDLHDFLDDDIGGFLKEDGGEARFRSGQVEVGKCHLLFTSSVYD
jgi:chromosome transmission fidelity protein 4